MRMENHVEDFVKYIESNKVAIYNEASIQYELAIFLRRKLERKNYKIQLERNVSAFGIDKNKFKEKKEIDVSIFRGAVPEKSVEKHAIEIKFPTNGQCPAQMFSFCMDIKFLEKLKDAGFQNNLFIAFSNDHLFWEGPKREGIYEPFRRSGKLAGVVKDPFSSYKITFKGKYCFEWQNAFNDTSGEQIKYFCVEI